MRFLRLLAVLFAFLAAPVAAQSSPFGDAPAMDDAELADERGGGRECCSHSGRG